MATDRQYENSEDGRRLRAVLFKYRFDTNPQIIAFPAALEQKTVTYQAVVLGDRVRVRVRLDSTVAVNLQRTQLTVTDWRTNPPTLHPFAVAQIEMVLVGASLIELETGVAICTVVGTA